MSDEQWWAKGIESYMNAEKGRTIPSISEKFFAIQATPLHFVANCDNPRQKEKREKEREREREREREGKRKGEMWHPINESTAMKCCRVPILQRISTNEIKSNVIQSNVNKIYINSNV